MEKQITIDQVAGILKDPSVHALTKTIIEAAMKRDIVDAYYDVLLATICIKAIMDYELYEHNKPALTIITGKEKYKVIDLDSGGEAFFDNKLDAYNHMAVIKTVLRHNYRLEVRE